jgi:predicted nucleic acid-binding protein
MKVFVDTGAWLAFYDRNDQHHESACRITEHLKAERANLVLSEFVLAESVTLIRFRIGHAWAVRFGQVVLESRFAELLSVDEPTRRRAWDIFRRYEDKEFSFTDCTSFALMEQLGLKTAFAFDRHFEQYGFALVQPHLK